jgi:hypothetical protein
MQIYALRPDIFEFEPLDYNANRGIDIIARNKSENKITEGEHWYVELKYLLQTKKFNHAFEYLRWIVCWDFDKNVSIGTELQGIVDNDTRQLKTDKDNGINIYFLDAPKKANKVQVIRLKEYLKQKLDVEFCME